LSEELEELSKQLEKSVKTDKTLVDEDGNSLVDEDGNSFNPKVDEFFKNRGFRKIGAGVSRYVYKYPCKRIVYKVDLVGNCNLAEFALYNGLKDSVFKGVLAKCLDISESRIVLTQEYVRKRLPEYSFSEEFNDFTSLLNRLESTFWFVGEITGEGIPVCDFHDGNLKIASNSSVKIVDYAALLCSYTLGKKFNLEKTIERIANKAKFKTDNLSLYINKQNELTLEAGQRIITISAQSPLLMAE
jgi:hypothetical protein